MADNSSHIGAWQSGDVDEDQPHVGAWQGDLEPDTSETLLPIIMNNYRRRRT